MICNPIIPAQHLKSVVVPQSSKGPLQDYLTRLGLSQTSLFGDIPGLAAANTRRTLLQRTEPPRPEQHRDRGNRAYQAARYDDALAAYEAYGAGSAGCGSALLSSGGRTRRPRTIRRRKPSLHQGDREP